MENRQNARLAGLLYLVIIVCAGFAQGGVREQLIVDGDPGATADAIRDAMPLFRAGLFLDLVAFMADAAVAVLFYVILRGAGHTLALVAAAFRLIAHPAIGSLNLLAHWAAAALLGGTASAASLGAGEAEALAYTALELHGAGYLIAGAFFGVHMLLLGVLLVRSLHFPDWLGYLVAIAGVAYLVETTTFFVLPGLASAGATFVVFAASIAELTLCGWLLVRGVRDAAPAQVAS